MVNGELNYKRKHPARRKYRLFRHGYKSEGRQMVRNQTDRDCEEKIKKALAKNRD